ncbi:MAG TPA: methyltransferase domain-containing protein [Mycobacteriales bacterium]|nr:methyltransferase domain-containing protein [Mycobacteriales bacterium]
MPYDPARYWDERLRGDFSLRGVGHHLYSESYNRWLYRAKRRALRAVLPRPQPGERALDVGSGTGWVLAELARAGWSADGCDISPYAVEQLRERFPDREVFRYQLGADQLPRADQSIQLVTLLDVAYHVMSDDEWRRGVRDLARVLAPGGSLVVVDRLGSTTVSVEEHVRFRSLDSWTSVLGAPFLLRELRPALRWLSRDPDTGALRRWRPRLRGAVEYALDRAIPREPHLRIARFERTGSAAGPHREMR